MKDAIISTSNPGDDHSAISAEGHSFVIYEWSGSGPDYLHAIIRMMKHGIF